MKKSRILSLVLAIMMVLSMISGITVYAEETPYVSASIYGVSDIAGKTSFSGGLRTVAKVNKTTNVKLIIAVYNGGTTLQKAAVKDIELKQGETVINHTYTVDGLSGAADQTAKALLWTDIDNTLVPLSEAMPVEGEITAQIVGIPKDYQTFEAVIDGYTITESDTVSYNWEYKKEDNQTYADATALAYNEGTSTGKTFTSVFNNGTFIRYRVTVTLNGKQYQADVLPDITTALALRPLRNDGKSLDNNGRGGKNILNYANKNTPDEYVFTADGMEFILLDSLLDSIEKSNDNTCIKPEKSAFMLMTKNTVGTKAYISDSTSTDARAKNQYPYDMTMWLNNKSSVNLYGGTNGRGKVTWNPENVDYTESGYKGNSGYTQIPESVLSHVDDTMYWHTERGGYWHNSANPDKYCAVQGGLQLLSLTELVKYGDKIGLADCDADWWLRTPAPFDADNKNQNGNHVQSVGRAVLGSTSYTLQTAVMGIRPVFYVDKDFFLEEPIDMSKAGADVIMTLSKRYSRAELKAAGYSEADLSEYFDPIVNYSGKVTSAKIKSEGTFEVNNTLKLVTEGTNIEGARIDWYTSLTDLGCFVEEGVTGDTFIPSDSCAGKYVKAKVTLKNGTVYSSNVIKIEDALAAVSAYAGVQTDEAKSNPIGTNETDQDDYIFSVGDTQSDGSVKNETKLVLLDVKENDKSHFLVMTNSYVGQRYYYGGNVESNASNDTTYASAPLDMAAYLNSLDEVTLYKNSEKVMMPDYEYKREEVDGVTTQSVEQKTDEAGNLLTKTAYGAYRYGSDGQPLSIPLWTAIKQNGSGLSKTKLPDAVWKSINYNQVWNCEPAGTSKIRWAVKAGLMLPSVTEIKEYASKFNLYPGGRTTTGTNSQKLASSWWTRTSVGGGTEVYAVNFEYVGQVKNRPYQNGWAGGCSMRPIFYLDRDFFINYKIDLSKCGSDVLKKIRAEYTDEELSGAGYTQDDISKLDTAAAAEAAE